MRKLRTVAASFAVTGLAVPGVMAVPGAGANAATNQAITGCSVDSSNPVIGRQLATRAYCRLACSVDGRTRFARETFTARDLRSTTQVVNPQRAVGSRQAVANRHP
jgi:hypothetical protein